MTAILVRSAVTTEVRFDRREIDVLAVPYETQTHIWEPHREYDELIAPGAFGNVQSRAGRIKVLREHNPVLLVGRCSRLDPSPSEGLHATLSIAATPLGDESLVLASEGVLDTSIGVSSLGGDQWTANRSRVRRTNLRLHEISLVALPAYETAAVLAVRSQSTPLEQYPVSTPARDEIRAWMVEHRYSAAPTDRTRQDLPL